MAKTHNRLIRKRNFRNQYNNLFPLFYAGNILMLAPLVGVEKVPVSRVKLTALPLNIPGTSCIPCRAVVTEE